MAAIDSVGVVTPSYCVLKAAEVLHQHRSHAPQVRSCNHTGATSQLSLNKIAQQEWLSDLFGETIITEMEEYDAAQLYFCWALQRTGMDIKRWSTVAPCGLTPTLGVRKARICH